MFKLTNTHDITILLVQTPDNSVCISMTGQVGQVKFGQFTQDWPGIFGQRMERREAIECRADEDKSPVGDERSSRTQQGKLRVRDNAERQR